MAGIAQNGHNCLIFIVVLLLRLESIKKRWKKKERYSKCKLKWLSP